MKIWSGVPAALDPPFEALAAVVLTSTAGC